MGQADNPEGPSTAVSYTHLDVYKRQLVDGVVRVALEVDELTVARGAQRAASASAVAADVRAFLGVDELPFCIGRGGQRGGDVYKRQELQHVRVVRDGDGPKTDVSCWPLDI